MSDMDMVERVARALLDVMEAEIDETMYGGGLMSDVAIPKLARAAIEAMRAPTPAMIDAGVAYRLRTTIGGDNSWPADTISLWRVMFDAALGDKT